MECSKKTGAIVEMASAKINLALDVLKKRADGYHEVRMVMQSVATADTVRLSPATALTVTTDQPGLTDGPGNLAYRAARAFERATGKTAAVHIAIEKHIPMGAGLAGGSADAAAVLRGLNRLLETGLSMDELRTIGASIGSDVPFCLAGGTALAEGRGEVITPLPPLPVCPVLLANPGFEVSTAWVYGHYQAELVEKRPAVPAMLAAIERSDWNGVIGAMGNVLESVTIPAYPAVAAIKQTMQQAGARAVLMSGSGPTVFALTKDKAQTELMAEAVRQQTGAVTYITETKKVE